MELLRPMVEMAQIMHFCKTFRAQLHLPQFSRTDLENAFLSTEKMHPLLAEIHYKLCKKYAGYKVEVL